MAAFRRKSSSPDPSSDVHDVHTVLGSESSFVGKLTFEGTVRLDGRFVGEVHSDNLLIIGPHARVEATLHVGSLIVHGEVIGNIVARQWVEVHAAAKVFGDVRSPELMLDRGAIFQGTSNMEGAAPSAAAPQREMTLLKSAGSA